MLLYFYLLQIFHLCYVEESEVKTFILFLAFQVLDMLGSAQPTKPLLLLCDTKELIVSISTLHLGKELIASSNVVSFNSDQAPVSLTVF